MSILMYNRLPQELIDSENVTLFQQRLTRMAKRRAQVDETTSWRNAFQSCADVVNYPYSS